MTARHWMQIAALSFALGLTGAAIAQNTEGTTSSEDRAGISNSAIDAPSAGAIVTPEDNALGMGQDKERRGVPGDADEDESLSNGDRLNANPGTSGDEGLINNPGITDDDEMSVHPRLTEDDEMSVYPGLTGDEELNIGPGQSNEQLSPSTAG